MFEIRREGSFLIDRMETFKCDWDCGFRDDAHRASRGERVSKMVRAVVESMLESHFGRNAMDELFRRYEKLVEDRYLKREETENLCVVVSLMRKD